MALIKEKGETVIRVAGDFDAEAASKLLELLECTRAHQHAPVVIDFRTAHEVTAVGLAALVGASDVREHVRLRGLSLHSRRILRHLTAGAPPLDVEPHEQAPDQQP